MTSRAAEAAAQSDPDRNRGFRRWPAPATGPDDASIRCWHAADLPAPAMSWRRRQAEAAWAKLVRKVQP